MTDTAQNIAPSGSNKGSASSADTARAAWFAKNPDHIICSVDADVIREWAVQPAAKQTSRQHHESVHTVASHGAAAWLTDRKEVTERDVNRLRSECDAANAEVAKTPREFIGLGGGEKRTVGVWMKILIFMLIGLSGAVIDAALVYSLVGEAAPEKLTDFAYLAGMMSAAFFSVAALKASTMLGAQDPDSSRRRFERWARILPWAALPMLAGLAMRYVQLSTDAAASMFSEANSSHDYLALAVFFLQLIAGTVVSTGSLLVATRLALLTAPATCRPNPAWNSLNDVRHATCKELKAAEGQLAIEHAQLETLVAHRAAFLGRADAEFEAELRRRENLGELKAQADELKAEAKRLEAESLAAEQAQAEVYKMERADLQRQRKEEEEERKKQEKEQDLKIEEQARKVQTRREQLAAERLRQFRNISDQLSTN
jgi:hypothetical protein